MQRKVLLDITKTIIFSRQEHTCSARVAVIHGYRYLGNVQSGWLLIGGIADNEERFIHRVLHDG